MDSRLYSRCRIIDQVYSFYKTDPNWEEFWSVYDVAPSLAFCVMQETIEELNEKGERFINEVWDDLARIAKVDPEEEYDYWLDMLEIGAIDE